MNFFTSLFAPSQPKKAVIPTYQVKVNEHEAFDSKLSELAQFIQSESNIAKLFSNGEHGGELDFSSFGHFNINRADDNNLIRHTMEQYNNQLHRLQTTDFKLSLSFVIGLVAIALSPLSAGLSILIAATAFAYFGYQLKHREDVRESYIESQQNMTNVYIWAMNDTNAKITLEGQDLPTLESCNHDSARFATEVQKSLHPQITAMHNLFNPMLSDQNIWHYTRNDLDEAITIDKSAREENAVANETTTKMQLSLSYLLYGQHQGTPVQVAKGLAEIIRRAFVDIGTSVYNAFSSNADKSEQEQFATQIKGI